MAEEHTKCGDGIQQHPAQQVRVGEHPSGLLPDAQEFGAQIVLYFGAVEGVVDGQGGDHVLPVQQAMLFGLLNAAVAMPLFMLLDRITE